MSYSKVIFKKLEIGIASVQLDSFDYKDMRLFVWDSRTVHESDKTKCAPQYKLCHIQKLVVAAGCCLTSIPRPARRQPRILEVAYALPTRCIRLVVLNLSAFVCFSRSLQPNFH